MDREININELYSQLICALTHNITVCDGCKKCPGGCGAEIRINLVRELAGALKKELPWDEGDKNDNINK